MLGMGEATFEKWLCLKARQPERLRGKTGDTDFFFF
jgi:hypothetical protein